MLAQVNISSSRVVCVCALTQPMRLIIPRPWRMIVLVVLTTPHMFVGVRSYDLRLNPPCFKCCMHHSRLLCLSRIVSLGGVEAAMLQRSRRPESAASRREWRSRKWAFAQRFLGWAMVQAQSRVGCAVGGRVGCLLFHARQQFRRTWR